LAATGMSLVSLDGCWLKVNPALCQMLGYSEEELLAMRFQDITHPADLEADLALTNRLLKGEIPSMRLEKRYFCKDGSTIWIQLDVALARDASGEPVYLVSQTQDISARKQAEAALRESSRWLEMAVQGADLGIWDLDLRTGANHVNQNWASMLGYTPDEIEPSFAFFESLLHPEDLEPSRRVLQQHLREKTSLMEHEQRLRARDGSWHWVLSRGKVIEWDAQGRPLRAMGTHLDITQRKRAEEALQRSEAQYRETVESLEEGVIVYSPQGEILSANKAAERVLGLSQNQLRGRTSVDPSWRFVQQDGSPFPVESYPTNLVRKTGKPQKNVVMGVYKPDGSLSWILVNSRPIPNKDQPFNVVTSFLDFTEYKQAEEALRATESRLRFLLTTSPATIFTFEITAPYRTTFISENVQQLLGYSPQAYLGDPSFWAEHIHPEDREQMLAQTNKLVQEGRLRLEYRFRHADGSYRWMKDESHLVLDAQGQPLEAVGYFVDISQRKQAEAAQKEKEQAEAASRAKSEFLSHMSHELRTPLNSILGFAQLLELDATDPTQRQNLHYILTAGQHLLQLINELLDISRIEAGRLSLSLEPVSISEIVRECVHLVRPLADSRAIRIELEGIEVEHLVLADRQRLIQVLLNLLSNAIKYNREQGLVRLSCTASSGALRLSVSDTGFGITPVMLQRLFTPFDRLGVERGEGIGLGLALSKWLVEAMRGKLWAESTLNQGSTFWLELPLVQASTHQTNLIGIRANSSLTDI